MYFDFLKSERKWNAKWIWENSNDKNSWMDLRKKFTLSSVPQKAEAYIAAESRYWLYINGKNVVFEGGLKRGYDLDSSYYDVVDIAEYLKEGENIIYVLAWYWGLRETNFSVNSAGKPGFLFEADLGEIMISSDSSWKIARNKAYLDDSGSVEGILEPQPIHDLPEFNIWYDARLETKGQEELAFDDSAWENAVETAEPGDKPWGRLFKRPIPIWKDFGIRAYRNSAEFEGFRTEKAEQIGLDTDYNCQMTPYMMIEADEEGKRIDIYTDTFGVAQGTHTIKSTYITKKGVQEFEGLSWFSGEKVFYTLPEGIKVIKLGYRESGFGSERKGYFRCDDEFFNVLWEKSARTLYITMRDNFMDCPDRERAQWWGDVNNEMMMLMYSFDTDSYNLYEKAWYTKAGMSDSFGEQELRTVVPSLDAKFELPAQELAGVCGLWEYYLYSGNKLILEEMYPYAKRYTELWNMSEDGTVEHRKGSWDWYDWGEDIDVYPLENAWYYFALCNLEKAARVLGKNSDIDEYNDKKQKIRKGFEKYFTSEGFMSGAYNHPDDRVAGVVGIVELDTKDREDILKKIFNTVDMASPYMEKYVIDAMCRICSMEEVQARLKRRYGCMVDGPLACSTLWEHWGYYGGSKNHAWSGGPLITMSKNMAGIKPLIPGYDRYAVEPDMGTLRHIETLVPTVKGDIELTLVKENEEFDITLTSPAGTVAEVLLESGKNAKNKTVFINGVKYIVSGQEIRTINGATLIQNKNEKLKISLIPGKWEIKVI